MQTSSRGTVRGGFHNTSTRMKFPASFSLRPILPVRLVTEGHEECLQKIHTLSVDVNQHRLTLSEVIKITELPWTS